MQQEDADLLAVGAARDLRRVGRLVHRHPHVPVEPERLDAENVLGLPQRQVRLRQHRLGAGEDLLARDASGGCHALIFGAMFMGIWHPQLLTKPDDGHLVVPAKASTHNRLRRGFVERLPH